MLKITYQRMSITILGIPYKNNIIIIIGNYVKNRKRVHLEVEKNILRKLYDMFMLEVNETKWI